MKEREERSAFLQISPEKLSCADTKLSLFDFLFLTIKIFFFLFLTIK